MISFLLLDPELLNRHLHKKARKYFKAIPLRLYSFALSLVTTVNIVVIKAEIDIENQSSESKNVSNIA